MANVKLIKYECPACSTTYWFVAGSRKYCPSCETDIGEMHLLLPSDELHARLASIRAKREGK